MDRFAIWPMATEGLRLVRKRPALLATWWPCWFVIQTLLTVIGTVPTWWIFAHGTRTNLTLMYVVAAPLAICVLLLRVALDTVMVMACTRAFLQPDAGAGGLRLGRAELRLMGVGLTVAVAMGVLVFLFRMAVTPTLNAVVPMGLEDIAEEVGAGLPAVVAGVLIFGRLAFAPSLCLEGPARFGESWRQTRPVAGRLLAVLFVSVGVALLVYVAGRALTSSLAPEIPSDQRINLVSLQSYFPPSFWPSMAIMSLASAIACPIIFCPAAAVFRKLASRQEDVF